MWLKKFRENLKSNKELSPVFGAIKQIDATKIIGEKLSVRVGETVVVKAKNIKLSTLGMVTEVSKDSFSVTPFGFIEGFKAGDRIYKSSNGLTIPVGEGLLGRVVNPFMDPIDDKGIIQGDLIETPIIHRQFPQ